MTLFNRRTESRDSVFFRAKIFDEKVELPITVRNLSPEGAMLQGARWGAPGSTVSLYLADVGYVDATIAWVEGRDCGIQFLKPIDHRLLRRRRTASFGQAAAIDFTPRPRRTI